MAKAHRENSQRETKKGEVTESHLRCIETEIGTSARYRPEHVAAAALLRNTRPLRYVQIVRLSRMVLAQIRGRTLKPYLNTVERILCEIPYLTPRRFSINRS